MRNKGIESRDMRLANDNEVDGKTNDKTLHHSYHNDVYRDRDKKSWQEWTRSSGTHTNERKTEVRQAHRSDDSMDDSADNSRDRDNSRYHRKPNENTQGNRNSRRYNRS